MPPTHTLDPFGEDALRRVVGLATWRAAARRSAEKDDADLEVRDGVKLREAILLDAADLGEAKAVDLEKGTADFVVSTGARDRDRDTVALEGWDLRNFKRNPVVPFAHDYRSLPIAQATKIAVDGKALVSTAKFYDGEDFPFPMTVLRMVDARFLRAASVGFIPLEWSFNEDAKGVDFKRQELLEWSVVPVPANPEALRLAMKDLGGEALEPLRDWCLRFLDEATPEKGLWVPADRVNEARKILEGRGFTVTVPATDASTAEESKSGDARTPDLSGGAEPTKPQRATDASPASGPRDVSRATAPEDLAWRRPTLADFTDEPWEHLSDAQKDRVAGHFAWTPKASPERFADLKLPHHRADDGRVVFRGVASAMHVLLGGRGGVELPDGERRAVYDHLASHYRQFGKEPPEFRFVEAQVLATLADVSRFDLEAGILHVGAAKEPTASAPAAKDDGEEIEKLLAQLEAGDDAALEAVADVVAEAVGELTEKELDDQLPRALGRVD